LHHELFKLFRQEILLNGKRTNRAKYILITWENFSAKLFQCLKGKHALSGVILHKMPLNCM